MRFLCAAVLAALLAFGTTRDSQAQDVTLTSRDGTVRVTGTLLGFDGELYRIDTEYGELTVDGLQVSCEGPGCPDLLGLVSRLRISGSRTMGEVLMPALVETYAIRKNLRVARRVISDTEFEYSFSDAGSDTEVSVITFHIRSTAEGFADLVADEADLVLSTREVTASEVRLGSAAGIGNLNVARRSRIVALDALVPIVSRRNPLDAVVLEDLAKVFAGEISDWSELTEERSGPIVLHLRDMESGLAEEFRRRVMSLDGQTLSTDIVFHSDNAGLSDAVSRNPSAIGIAAFSDTGNAKALDLLGTCGKRVSASSFGLKTEDYPLTTPLFIYSPIGRPPPLARELIGYIRSSSAQPVIARSGFVDLRVQEVPVDAQGQRLANAIIGAGGETSLDDLKTLIATMEGTSRLDLEFPV